jgi:uncharacterized protein YfbU (UPF0304 family)
MLAEIKQGLNLQGGVNAEFVTKALAYGYDWAFDTETFGLHCGRKREPMPRNVQEIMYILEMWSWLETDYNRLSDEDKALVKRSNNGHDVHFPGFDGNSLEGELSIANFITNNLDKWDHLKGRTIPNSHRSDMDQYRGMLPAFERARKRANPLTAQDIIDTLQERIHPSNS